MIYVRNHGHVVGTYCESVHAVVPAAALNPLALRTYTIIQSITSSEMCSLHLTHPSAHTLGEVGSSWGFGALLKGLTSVVDNFCRSRGFEPTTSGYKSNALSIRPRLQDIEYQFTWRVVEK